MTGGTSRTDAHGGAIIHNYADVGELIQWSDEAFDVVQRRHLNIVADPEFVVVEI